MCSCAPSGGGMVCTRCGIVGADARPNWGEMKAERELATIIELGDWNARLGIFPPRLAGLSAVGLRYLYNNIISP